MPHSYVCVCAYTLVDKQWTSVVQSIDIVQLMTWLPQRLRGGREVHDCTFIQNTYHVDLMAI